MENPLRDRTAALVVRARLDSSGEPAADLGVTLMGLRPEDLRRGTTDGAGMVVFEGLRAGRKAVSGTFAGLSLLTLGKGERRTVELLVPQGVAARVRVTTRDDVPVAGAAVLLSSQVDGTLGSAVATTGANGECELSGVELGRNLWVEAEGFETSYVQPIQGGGRVDVVLTKAGWSLAGRVVRAGSGEGIPEASVSVEGYVTPGSISLPDGSARVYSPPPPSTSTADAQGAFRVRVSETTGLWLVAQAEGYAAKHHPLALETLLAGTPLVVALEPSHGLFGFVRDEQGTPVKDASIAIHAQDLIQPLATQSEDDGSFCVPDVPAGDVLLRARAIGGYTGQLSTTASPGSEDVIVVVSTAGSVLVRLRTALGEPLVGCAIVRVMEPAGPTPSLVLHDLGRTDGAGTCRIFAEKLEAGAAIGFLPKGASPSFPFGVTEWSEGESELAIEIPDAPDPGTLRFDCGPAAEDALAPSVSLFVRASASPLWLGRAADEHGSCTYEGLPPGTYRAVACVGNVYYGLGLFDIGPGEVRVVPFDLRGCEAFPRTSLAEQQ